MPMTGCEVYVCAEVLGSSVCCVCMMMTDADEDATCDDDE
jgi:hypothetical protein